jgi:hypothetical protein
MIVDRATGVVREAEIFVAVLGASNYTYAEATWTQKLADDGVWQRMDGAARARLPQTPRH